MFKEQNQDQQCETKIDWDWEQQCVVGLVRRCCVMTEIFRPKHWHLYLSSANNLQEKSAYMSEREREKYVWWVNGLEWFR